MIQGSCLCGTVRYAVDEPFDRITHCHCSMCRKVHGTAFATYAACAPEKIHWLQGEDAVERYRSSEKLTRCFCRHCGSVVPGRHEGANAIVPVGNLDEEPQMKPDAHIFAGSVAPWHVIDDDLARFDTWRKSGPPGTPPASTEGDGGGVSGSCLCGAVAFTVNEPFIRAHYCHCSRCRKARSAAHAANAFTSKDGVTFTRGEDNITVFKLPGARFFSVAFCNTCGSGVPRLDDSRDIAIIPLGALDDDPGRKVDSNIFAGSAAGWYPAIKALPTFDGPAT
jgi:hypothetical protein